MTGDRRLNQDEMLRFKMERLSKEQKFFALETILNANEEPTLFELAILELYSYFINHKELIIDLYKKIKIIEENKNG